jgi:hypothetical protein
VYFNAPNVNCNLVYPVSMNQSQTDRLISSVIDTRKRIQNLYLDLQTAIKIDETLTKELQACNIHI